jgi:hypothetical protein
MEGKGSTADPFPIPTGKRIYNPWLMHVKVAKGFEMTGG